MDNRGSRFRWRSFFPASPTAAPGTKPDAAASGPGREGAGPAGTGASAEPAGTGPGAGPGGSSRRRRTVAGIAGATIPRVAGGQLARLPIAFRFWDGSVLAAGAPPQGPLTARDGNGAQPRQPVVVATRPRAVSHLLHQPGELGLARAWVDGSLTVEGDLEALLALRRALPPLQLSAGDRLRLLAAAVAAAGPVVLRPPPIPAIEATVGRRSRLLGHDRHGGRRHSLNRDRTAVRHHYDVSNDFYRLVLGPTLVYSCAYFSSPHDTLEQAQEHKLDLICRKLALRPGERLLDIGCGWGSLVLHAAAHYGVSALGVTLSEPQARLARQRATEQGLQDRVEIRVADYRELRDEPFDKIASVGMYEHVGRAELGTYVTGVNRLLVPGGLFLNHGIARLYSQPPTADTFISRYIFPDGELHPVGALLQELAAARLEVRDLESLREHYPLTLRRWVANLRARRQEATALVGAERERAWELYMIASAEAFEAGDITVYQVLSARPGAGYGLPLDRLQALSTPPAVADGRRT